MFSQPYIDNEPRGPLPYRYTAATVMVLSMLLGALAALLIRSSLQLPSLSVMVLTIVAIGLVVVFVYYVLAQRMHRGLLLPLPNRADPDPETKKSLQQFCDSIPTLVGVAEIDGDDLGHIYDNAAACRFFGVLPGETRGRRSSELHVPPATIALWVDQCRISKARNAPVRFEFQTPAVGETRWFSTIVSPLEGSSSGKQRFGYIASDISELKKTESALTEAKERLQAALEAGALATWDWDIQNDLVYGDATLIRLFNVPQSYLRGAPMAAFVEHIHEQDRELIRNRIHRSLETGETYSAEYRLTNGHQKPRWIAATARVLYDSSGKPARFPGVAVDITHLKEVEEALTNATVASQQQLAELEAVYMFAPVGLCVFDPKLRWKRINKLMAGYLGRSQQEFVGRTFQELLPDLAAAFERPLAEVVQTKEPVLNVEIAGESPTERGTIRIWRSSFYPQLNGSSNVNSINVVTEDITDERRSTEEHLAHRTILEMVGNQAPMETILDALAQAVEKIFPGSVSYIVHDDERGDVVEPIGHTSNELVAAIFNPPVASDPEGIFAMAMKRRQEVLLPELEKEQRGLFIDRLKALGVRSCWVKPIVLLDGKVWGACAIHHQHVALRPTHAEREHLDVLLRLAATVIERRRFLDQLTSTSERLQYAERAGGIGVFDWDMKTGAVIWTPQMNELYGIPAGLFGGHVDDWKKMVHPDDLPALLELVDQETKARRRDFQADYRIIHPNGEIRWTAVQGGFEYDSQGTPTRMIGVVSDITERKRVEQQSTFDKERLSLALEAGNLGFWDWHVPSGSVQFGGCWASMLGYQFDEIEPHVRSWEKLVHPEDMPAVQRALEAHFKGERPVYEAEHRLLHKDGSWHWILDRGRVVERDERGAPVRVVGIHADIHEQHQIREELKAASKRKDEFLATLAHELRNPLAPLRTGLAIIKRNPSGPEAAQAREMMSRQLSHMVRLIDDLLDVSRITRGKLEIRSDDITLQSVVESAIEGSRPFIDAAHQTLSVELPIEEVRIRGDLTRLSQVLSNLLVNAAKYTPEGGYIKVAASMQGADVIVQVTDNGIGIPPEMLTSVFDMFGQVNQTLERAQGGLGIGLALVKRIVELHKGEVKAESLGLGKGSTFTIKLPARVERARQETPDAAKEEGLFNMKKVLVVDDNVDGAMSLKLYLELLGYEVSVAHTGHEALVQVAKEMPAVIFLDIGLPEMSGFDVARKIREMSHGKEPIIAAVTGWGTDEDKRKSAEAGCNVHLTKPIDLSEAEKLLVH
jgi:PAS domain S-box-containing protein